MNHFPTWIAIACVASLALWLVTKKSQRKHVWETTPGGAYEVFVTDKAISCSHPKRPEEKIQLDKIDEIRLVTTSDGPRLPDMWFLFIGNGQGCSVPSEAKGFDQIWDLFKTRFPGLNYEAIMQAGTTDAQKVLWKKLSNESFKSTLGDERE